MTATHRLRLVIVEDEALFRDLLRLALERHPRFEVIATFDTPEAALEQVPRLRPDIALLDIDLGGSISGVELGLALRQALPRLGVVILSNHQDLEFVAALGSNALSGWSYLLKKSVRNVDALTRAIEGAFDGLVVLDPQLVAANRVTASGPLSALTPRQLEVLHLIAQGHTNAGIASALGLSVKTVDNLTNTLYQALEISLQGGEVHPRVKAVLVYLEASRGGH